MVGSSAQLSMEPIVIPVRPGHLKRMPGRAVRALTEQSRVSARQCRQDEKDPVYDLECTTRISGDGIKHGREEIVYREPWSIDSIMGYFDRRIGA